MNYAYELLNIKAVFLSPDEPFTWASGIKSPIYCDNRLILGYPKLRREVAIGLKEIVESKYPNIDCIYATATAGIPHGALIADMLELPFGYVRSSTKDHGRTNQIEGFLKEKSKAVVIEDLISTGGSSLKVVEALIEAGIEVLGVVAIFSYELEKAKELFSSAKIQYHTLTNYNELLDVALQENYINDAQLSKLKKWRKDPNDTSWMNE